MLDFERELAAALTKTPDPAVRAGVASFVEGSLDTMPEFLRLGVLAESVAFGTFARIVRLVRRHAGLDTVIGMLERSPVSLVRQYVRLFRSLVLLAEEELTEAAAA
jgi:hypothetical protein